MKLERIDPQTQTATELTEAVETLSNGVTIEELADFSRRVAIPEKMLPGGLVVVFKDPSQEDLEFLETQMKSCATQLEAMKRFGCRLCTQWGDKPGVSPVQWNKLRGAVSTVLIKVLNNFFQDQVDI